jgi:hypothetical protein
MLGNFSPRWKYGAAIAGLVGAGVVWLLNSGIVHHFSNLHCIKT